MTLPNHLIWPAASEYLTKQKQYREKRSTMATVACVSLGAQCTPFPGIRAQNFHDFRHFSCLHTDVEGVVGTSAKVTSHANSMTAIYHR